MLCKFLIIISLLAAGFFSKGHLDARLKRVFSHREERYGSMAE